MLVLPLGSSEIERFAPYAKDRWNHKVDPVHFEEMLGDGKTNTIPALRRESLMDEFAIGMMRTYYNDDSYRAAYQDLLQGQQKFSLLEYTFIGEALGYVRSKAANDWIHGEVKPKRDALEFILDDPVGRSRMPMSQILMLAALILFGVAGS